MQGPATWDGHPRCHLAGGEDVAVAPMGAATATNCPESASSPLT